MNRLFSISFISLVCFISIVSCRNTKETNPDVVLSAEEKSILFKELIPYSAKLSKTITSKNRFEDSSRNKLVKMYQDDYMLSHFYKDADSTFYFCYNRKAPSLYEKRLSIAGSFKRNSEGSIVQYKEVFWTFKMKEEELKKKTDILFQTMIDKKDMSEYYPQHATEEWIEFPDARVYYNSDSLEWLNR